MGQLQDSPATEAPPQGPSGSHHFHKPAGPIYIGPRWLADSRSEPPPVGRDQTQDRRPIGAGHSKR